MGIKRKFRYLFVAASLLLFIQPALAENPASNDTPWEKFSLDLGGFIANTSTDISLGSELGITVSVEDLLGLDSTESVARAGFFWRFTDNRRHRFDFDWFAFRRDGSKTVGQDFTIEDEDGNPIEILAGTQVTSKFNFDVYRAGYSYSFFQDDRIDLAFSVGLYAMPIEIGLNAAGVINVDETVRFTAPLPTLGLRMDFALTPKWFLRTNVEVFYLKIDEFTGTIYESGAALEYIPWKHLGFGLGFNTFNFEVEADGEDYPGIDFKGEIKFRYTGLLLYAKIPF